MTSETQWLTPKEAAAYLKMGVSTLAKMRMAKVGPAFARPRKNSVRYALEDLLAWMRESVFSGHKKSPGN